MSGPDKIMKVQVDGVEVTQLKQKYDNLIKELRDVRSTRRFPPSRDGGFDKDITVGAYCWLNDLIERYEV